MKLRGSLATVDAVSTNRPRMIVCAVASAAVTGVDACEVINRRTQTAHHAVNTSTLSSGDIFIICAWLLTALATALWFLTTPGYFKFKGAERRRLDDELVIHHRASSIRIAFFVLGACVLIAALASAGGHLEAWWPVAALTTSLCTGALSFAVMEWRANA